MLTLELELNNSVVSISILYCRLVPIGLAVEAVSLIACLLTIEKLYGKTGFSSSSKMLKVVIAVLFSSDIST